MDYIYVGEKAWGFFPYGVGLKLIERQVLNALLDCIAEHRDYSDIKVGQPTQEVQCP